MVPLLVLWAGFAQHRANGTSLLAIVPIALVGVVIYYRQEGQPLVDLRFALLLITGSVLGAFLGARLAIRIPDRHLKLGVAALLAVVGVKELVFP